jgi:hypothetical protein
MKGSGIGGWSLVLGSFAFLIFWGAAPLSVNDAIPWPVALAVHGMSIVLLSIGLVLTARYVAEPIAGSRVTRAGAAVAIAGLLAVLPLIPVGFGIFAVGLVLAGRDRIAAVVVAAGSVVLLATYVFGARVGVEDAPELSDGLRVAFQVSVLFIAIGLVIVGLGELRRVQRPPVSQEVLGAGSGSSSEAVEAGIRLKAEPERP